MDIINEYQKRAKDFTMMYGVSNDHITSIVASVMMTRDGEGFPGGSFVQSVVNNDLYGAVSRADSVCLKHLKTIVAANQYCTLNPSKYEY